jgi:demethylmenaquinone methyltransferase/2-methoxy-6-polyprenyl-1,4-benzoquinol methylase
MIPDSRPALRDALATPDSKRLYVRRLFSTIADRYDLITVLLSYGQDRRWKRRLTNLSGAAAGTHVLDLACGTGDIALALAARGATVTGLDVTHRMVQLAEARRLRTGAHARFVTADMTALPFGSGLFDVVTTGYGIRNVPEISPAIDEVKRVLKPGGTLLSLDFNRPENPAVRFVYLTYLSVVGSLLGFVLHRDPDTYRYIPESIRRYPGAAAVSEMFRARGFASSEYIPVLGGLMAIHRAVK